jgi:translation initiation factor 3 subunit E
MASAKYDNTTALCGFLDRHLVFPLFEFMEVKEIYPKKEMLKAKLELLSKTNMVDFAMEIYQEVHGEEAPEEMKKRREEVVQKFQQYTQQCGPLLELVVVMGPENISIAEGMIRDKTFEMPNLSKEYGITNDHLKGFYEFARFQFGCGDYSKAADLLSYYRLLSTHPDKSTNALWGKLASEILMQRWENALADLKLLQAQIDNKVGASAVVTMQQRTWLIHWGLFIFFNHPNGRNSLIELFFNERYLTAIQTGCPHVLRYLAAAVITNRRKRNLVKDLLRIVQQETYTYSDPITEFVVALFVQFDFESAQQKLRECEILLKNDYFLHNCHEEFLENARMFIFETYCRIHQCIEISMIADKLNMNETEAERWIVNLIRHAHFDARIDSENNQVILGNQSSSVHQQLIDKTKSLNYKTNEMALGVQKLGLDAI